MKLKKDGTPSVRGLRDYETILQQEYNFPEGSFGATVSGAVSLMGEEKELKKEVKEKEEILHDKTKETIERLTDENAEALLHQKWIQPLKDGIKSLVDQLFKDLETDLQELNDKYSETMHDIQDDIQTFNQELRNMMNDLTGNEADMKGIKAFQELLGGETNE